jgi:hypothetical protein
MMSSAGEVGIACFQDGKAELGITQIIDTSHAYRFVASEIISVSPDVIVLLDTHHTDFGGVNQAVLDACEVLSCTIHRVERSAFDDTSGTDMIQKYCMNDGSCLESLCASNYLAVGCAGAPSDLLGPSLASLDPGIILHPSMKYK